MTAEIHNLAAYRDARSVRPPQHCAHVLTWEDQLPLAQFTTRLDLQFQGELPLTIDCFSDEDSFGVLAKHYRGNYANG